MTRSLFSLEGNTCRRVASWLPSLERDLQRLMEQHLNTFLGVTFLASEWTMHGQVEMRVDTIGIDGDGFPVIIEYKKVGSDNILNQALFYLSALKQRQGDFTELVRSRLGEHMAQAIDWKGARALCIAHEFHPYDLNLLDQTRANVDLVTFEFFANSTFELDIVKSHRIYRKPPPQAPAPRSRLTFGEMLTFASPQVQSLARGLQEALGQIDEGLYFVDCKDGLIFSTLSAELGRVHLSGSMHPKLKVTMHSHPSESQALAFPGLKVGQGGSQVTLRTAEQLHAMVAWITDQVMQSMR